MMFSRAVILVTNEIQRRTGIVNWILINSIIVVRGTCNFQRATSSRVGHMKDDNISVRYNFEVSN